MLANTFSIIPASSNFEALLSEGLGGRVSLILMGVSHEHTVETKEISQTHH